MPQSRRQGLAFIATPNHADKDTVPAFLRTVRRDSGFPFTKRDTFPSHDVDHPTICVAHDVDQQRFVLLTTQTAHDVEQLTICICEMGHH